MDKYELVIDEQNQAKISFAEDLSEIAADTYLFTVSIVALTGEDYTYSFLD